MHAGQLHTAYAVLTRHSASSPEGIVDSAVVECGAWLGVLVVVEFVIPFGPFLALVGFFAHQLCSREHTQETRRGALGERNCTRASASYDGPVATRLINGWTLAVCIKRTPD
eukprot:scaffold320_cov54-Phaeocystis_antarctica.AAC.1